MKEHFDYVENKSKLVLSQLVVSGMPKNLSGTNMFKAQCNHLVECIDVEETSNSKLNTAARLEIRGAPIS